MCPFFRFVDTYIVAQFTIQPTNSSCCLRQNRAGATTFCKSDGAHGIVLHVRDHHQRLSLQQHPRRSLYQDGEADPHHGGSEIGLLFEGDLWKMYLCTFFHPSFRDGPAYIVSTVSACFPWLAYY